MKRAPKSAKLIVLDNNDPIASEIEAVQSRIRERAFELSHTRPHDARELYDWIAAESEIISVPPVEMIERDGMFEVKFAVAAANPDDINVMVTPDQILLKSDYHHEHSSDAGTVHLCDFKPAIVFRSVNLPKPIDVQSVKVNVDDGLIRVSAYKEGAEQARPKRAPAARKPSARKSRAKLP